MLGLGRTNEEFDSESRKLFLRQEQGAMTAADDDAAGHLTSPLDRMN
jgi:hypothetical protein